MSSIRLRGLSLHNLKAIDLDLPLGRLVTIVGPSGAGKSSLAFDTLYAEAHRRYVETFSPYARQFLDRLPRPPASAIDHLPAAVAIAQSNPVRSARSTVGTLAEVTYPARLLFFREAVLVCPGCGAPVRDQGPGDVVSALKAEAAGHHGGAAMLTVLVQPDRLDDLVRQGYFRTVENGRIAELSPGRRWGNSMTGAVELLVDRINIARLDPKRVLDSAEQAFSVGQGRVLLRLPQSAPVRFSRGLHCPRCDRAFAVPVPNFFSFNTPTGACTACHGFGRIMAVDWDLVIPDPSLSILDGAIRPLENWEEEKAGLQRWLRTRGGDVRAPWKDLPEDLRREVLFGGGTWPGVQSFFDYLEGKRYKAHVRMLLSRYRAYLTCPACGGSRFRPEVGWYRLAGVTLPEFYAMSLEDALFWSEEVAKMHVRDAAGRHLAEDLRARLSTLCVAGLGYLTLDRQSRTLSGGEVGRVALARAIGTELTETLYVLDEPTAGLHPADTARLLLLLRGLKNRGNTVVVVEHDRQVIETSDLVVELGPGSGEGGGRVIRVGPPLSGRYRVGLPEPKIPPGSGSRRVPFRFLRVRGARENNLKNISVSIPLGAVTCITGISGSGKSTLLDSVLFRGLLREKGRPTEPPGLYGGMEGAERVTGVYLLDQNPVGRTPRACPASYLHVLDGLRRLLAATADAGLLGLDAGAFSFNVPGGRCEACKGQGSEVVEMQFLPDLILPCSACHGRRFKPEVLSVRYRGKNMDEILHLTMEEAAAFFAEERTLGRAVAPALALDLGHLRLGQPVNTLSGGEAQRLKLARHLLQGTPEGGVFLLDEPTRGLHPMEVARLLGGLTGLVARGATAVVVEHDLQVVAAADWIIDLGPGGGVRGGQLVYEGPPEGLTSCPESVTGQALRTFGREAGAPAVSLSEDGTHALGCPEEARSRVIEIRGARHHNLKDLDLAIPKGKFVVVTGVSGSGKSSLAFDLVFAEGQRRYVEGLSSYLRQFIRLYERPDADRISGLTPTVAIEQRTSSAGPKSTVAILTEVAHYLRLLYAKAAAPVCPGCGRALEAQERGWIIRDLLDRWKGTEIRLLAPRLRRRKGCHEPEIEAAVRAGVRTLRIDGRLVSIPPVPKLSRYREHTLEWGFGPVKPDPRWREPLVEALERALIAGRGEATVLDQGGAQYHYSERYACPNCGVGLPDPDPLLFSFHTQAGQCPECVGMGHRPGSTQPCPSCGGSRLNPEARAWRLGGVGIDGLLAMEVDGACGYLEGWLASPPWPERLAGLAVPLVEEVRSRLEFLREVGLGYLPLDRAGDTLSGGEAQRIRLAAQVGSGLTGLTIVLDEPTIGLHPTDNSKLLKALRRLRDGGSTVLVVEHDEETLRTADWLIDLGPGGGRYGGRVVAQGTLEEVIGTAASATGRALKDPARRRLRPRRRAEAAGAWLRLEGIRCRNIQDMDLALPLGALVCVTGVSGSGKSTLLAEVLSPNVSARTKDPGAPPIFCRRVSGTEALARCAVVDHSPIGRTPRSCPATYVGLMGEIRALLARVPEARSRGYGPGRFSFNVAGGRCEACAGQGSRKVSLGFLPDVYVTCEECQGRRFAAATLDIRWRDRTVADLLDMTLEEARELFAPVPTLAGPLGVLCGLGLGYLTLGQPSPTLSGGEAQRLKIARELARGGRTRALYMLDEPTTGLHIADVARLVDHLHRLAERGNTVVVIEHNLDVISACDWVVDLGPQGGSNGGRLLFSGPPADFMAWSGASATREALADFVRPLT